MHYMQPKIIPKVIIAARILLNILFAPSFFAYYLYQSSGLTGAAAFGI